MREFPRDMDAFRAVLEELPGPDEVTCKDAKARNAQLTKPPGALGRLEELAIWYAAWRGGKPRGLDIPQVIVFAGNHGVAARGVSAFPADVTSQMVANFRSGGGAVNQLAEAAGARLDIHELELEKPTADFTTQSAMGEEEVLAALAAGWSAVAPDADLLVVGEMGIGNTTSAAAICAALLGGAGSEWVGRGTGMDDKGLRHKADVVDEGLARHAGSLEDPLEVLRRFGGRELAAMAGAVLRSRILGIPVILDGFICTSAALPLEMASPGALDHCVAGHVSAEAPHARLLEVLGKKPLLSLGMRLGEGTGAVLAIGILRGAVVCHSGMATFAEAGVSEG